MENNKINIELTNEEIETLLTVLQVDVRRLERLKEKFRNEGDVNKWTTCKRFAEEREKLYHKIDKA